MTSLIRDDFRTFNAQQFINSLNTGTSLYLGIGRPQYWNPGSSSDSPIGVPYNTIDGYHADWEDMMHLKRITASNVSVGVFKELWASGVKYDVYRHDWNGTIPSVYNGLNQYITHPATVAEAKCYVINASYEIYVCMKQGMVSGVVQPSLYSPETGTPIGTNTGLYKTSDGYVWKYIASTSSADVVTFSTADFHPVKTLTAAPGVGDTYYKQWTGQINSATYAGGIYNILINNIGIGYNGGSAGSHNVTNAVTDAQFTVIGDGTGLQLTVTYGSGGTIQDIEITNPGYGYSYATVTAVGGNGATFTVLFTPKWGLGTNPTRDLNAYFVITSCQLVAADGGVFTIGNDYRKVCLIANPFLYGTTTIATSAVLDATTTLALSGVSGSFAADTTITSNAGPKGLIVDSTASSARLVRTRLENNGIAGGNVVFQSGQTVTTSAGGAATISGVVQPTVAKYTGNIIYTEYRTPILRNLGQTETLQFVIEL